LKWADEVAGDQPSINVAEIQARCAEEITQDDYYDNVRHLGLDFGSDFRGLHHIWRRDGEALGRMILPESLQSEAHTYQFHPAFLDACFHLMGAPLSLNLETPYLLVGIERFELKRPSAPQLWNHTLLHKQDDGSMTGDIFLYNDAGELVAEARGLHLMLATRDMLQRQMQSYKEEWLYEIKWEEAPHADSAIILPAPDALTHAVTPQIDSLMAEHELAAYVDVLPALERASWAYIEKALHDLGWQYAVGTTHTMAEFSQHLNIAPRHQRLFARLCAILEEEGVLARSGDGWTVLRELETPVYPMRLNLPPQHNAEWHLLQQTGSQLAAVLTGQQDPLQLCSPMAHWKRPHAFMPKLLLPASTTVWQGRPSERLWRNYLKRNP
jgi:hypothetical protein